MIDEAAIDEIVDDMQYDNFIESIDLDEEENIHVLIPGDDFNTITKLDKYKSDSITKSKYFEMTASKVIKPLFWISLVLKSSYIYCRNSICNYLKSNIYPVLVFVCKQDSKS
mmetsp:Transcript_7463/g.6695  ORF Transcript_7463/g.6695 Transcript_7463/m.6695 type:complete len:112 (-) Transcript_7463:120-455(-)